MPCYFQLLINAMLLLLLIIKNVAQPIFAYDNTKFDSTGPGYSDEYFSNSKKTLGTSASMETGYKPHQPRPF